MNKNSQANNVFGPVSRRGFFGRAALAGTGLMLSSEIPVKSQRREDPGLCDFPVPIPHLTPNPFGTTNHFFFPGPVEGIGVPTDPTGPHSDGRDPSLIFNFEGWPRVWNRIYFLNSD